MTSKILAAVLRSALDSGPGPDDAGLAGCDWPVFESLMAHHGLAPVAYEILERHSASVPPALLERVRFQHRLAGFQSRAIGEMVDDVADPFSGPSPRPLVAAFPNKRPSPRKERKPTVFFSTPKRKSCFGSCGA